MKTEELKKYEAQGSKEMPESKFSLSLTKLMKLIGLAYSYAHEVPDDDHHEDLMDFIDDCVRDIEKQKQ